MVKVQFSDEEDLDDLKANSQKEWILWIGQEANFVTRSMLIPAVEFLKVRKDDYDTLKECAIQNAELSTTPTKANEDPQTHVIGE